MFRNIITLLIFCCISLTANAENIALKSDHPERHVVVKGDTLWDISSKFLKDPWQWSKIWNLNRAQIKNPHLIYPGDVIVLDMSGDSPSLKLLRESVIGQENTTDNANGHHPSKNITLKPHVVIEPLTDKEAIPTISLSAISPFLNQPLVIEKDQLQSSPRIIAGQDNRVILSPSTRIYVRNLPKGNELTWHVYREGDALIDPDTNTNLGYQATYLGDAKIRKFGDPATAEIISAKEEIFVKDRLIPTNNALQTNFVPHAPEHAIQGRIINIYGGLSEAGTGSIVSINRGTENGVEIGHVLAIKHFGRIINDDEAKEKSSFSFKKLFGMNKKSKKLEANMVKLPDERAGLMMVFRTFKNVSYALVMETDLSVNTLDAVTNP